MPQYRTNTASFDVPDTWVDQSLTAFRLPAASGGAEASFVVTRDETKGVAPFSDYVDRQVGQCRDGLPGFHLLRQEAITVDERPAAWLEFTWIKEPQVLLLRQILFDCGSFATICTLTTTERDLPHVDPAWRRVMASLKFDRPETVPFPPAAG